MDSFLKLSDHKFSSCNQYSTSSIKNGYVANNFHFSCEIFMYIYINNFICIHFFSIICFILIFIIIIIFFLIPHFRFVEYSCIYELSFFNILVPSITFFANKHFQCAHKYVSHHTRCCQDSSKYFVVECILPGGNTGKVLGNFLSDKNSKMLYLLMNCI